MYDGREVGSLLLQRYDSRIELGWKGRVLCTLSEKETPTTPRVCYMTYIFIPMVANSRMLAHCIDLRSTPASLDITGLAERLHMRHRVIMLSRVFRESNTFYYTRHRPGKRTFLGRV